MPPLIQALNYTRLQKSWYILNKCSDLKRFQTLAHKLGIDNTKKIVGEDWSSQDRDINDRFSRGKSSRNSSSQDWSSKDILGQVK